MVPFDVQLMGAIVLHEGKIAEMATGEGKTLVAVMPLYLNALAGKGVHLVTVNDYLARRDSEWMGEILRFLGLTVGVIQHDMPPSARRAAYACDVTYGTNNEFGFDYLRDNMAVRPEDQVQRGYHYAIVDEVDSVLIDEARTPLIISGPVQHSTQQYGALKPAIDRLVREQMQAREPIVAEVEQLIGGQDAGGHADDVDDDDEDGDGDAGGPVRGSGGRSGDRDQDWEVGVKLLTVQRGAPKNKRLFKLYAEHPGSKKLAQRVELDLIRDKRLHEIDEDLLFSIDEKNHITDLSDKGRHSFRRTIPASSSCRISRSSSSASRMNPISRPASA